MKSLIIEIADDKTEKELIKWIKSKFGKKVKIRKSLTKEKFLKNLLADKVLLDTSNYKFNREEANER